MLSSINPLGERAKGNRFVITATAHVVGSVMGGVGLGVIAGGIGHIGVAALPTTARAVLLATISLGAVLVETHVRATRRSVTSWRRQVNEMWLDEYRGTVYGFGYGAQLGFGVATIITSTITWVAVCAMVLQSSWTAAVIAGATFGLVRGLDIVRVANAIDGARLAAVMRHHHRMEPAMQRVTVTSLFIGGVALLAGIQWIQA